MGHKKIKLTFNPNTSGITLLDVEKITFKFEEDFVLLTAAKVHAEDPAVKAAWQSVTRAIYDSCTNTISGVIGHGHLGDDKTKSSAEDDELQWFFTIYLSLHDFRITVNSQGGFGFGGTRGPGNGGGEMN